MSDRYVGVDRSVDVLRSVDVDLSIDEVLSVDVDEGLSDNAMSVDRVQRNGVLLIWDLLLNCDIREVLRQLFGWYSDDQHIDIEVDFAKVDLSDEQQNKLQEFRTYVVDQKLKSSIGEHETNHIKNAVERTVVRFISIVSIRKLSYDYSVGSMAEGTKLKDPDEFDFIVRVTHTLLEPYEDIPDGSGKCKHLSDIGPHVHLKKINEDLFKVSDALGFSCIKNDIEIEEETPSGVLKFKSSYRFSNGPAVTLDMIWQPNVGKSMPISVDIVFALSIPFQSDFQCLSELKRLHAYLKDIEQDDVLVIPCRTSPIDSSNVCFKFALTFAEVAAVSKLSNEHITCYKFLKFVFTSNVTFADKILGKVVFSYLLKIPVLRHAAKCENGTNCLFAIIAEIEQVVSSHSGCLLKPKRISQVCSVSHLESEITRCIKILNAFLYKVASSDKDNEQLYKDLRERKTEQINSWWDTFWNSVQNGNWRNLSLNGAATSAQSAYTSVRDAITDWLF